MLFDPDDFNNIYNLFNLFKPNNAPKFKFREISYFDKFKLFNIIIRQFICIYNLYEINDQIDRNIFLSNYTYIICLFKYKHLEPHLDSWEKFGEYCDFMRENKLVILMSLFRLYYIEFRNLGHVNI